jgi:putative dehydrogenase
MEALHSSRADRAVKAAVIGLGSMGLGMARSIKRAGIAVTGFDVVAETVERFVTGDGGRGAATPAAAAAGADIVV